MPDAAEKFRAAAREQESFFAPLEKKLLVRMAKATPPWINSGHLTLLGFMAMFFSGICYWLSRWNKYMLLLVILCLAANWLGDSLDGLWRAFAIASGRVTDSMWTISQMRSERSFW
jgi:hypothetical protein